MAPDLWVWLCSTFQARGQVQVGPAHAAGPRRREIQGPAVRSDMRIVLVDRAVHHGPEVGRRAPGMEDRLTRGRPEIEAGALPPWSCRKEEYFETVETDRQAWVGLRAAELGNEARRAERPIGHQVTDVDVMGRSSAIAPEKELRNSGVIVFQETRLVSRPGAFTPDPRFTGSCQAKSS